MYPVTHITIAVGSVWLGERLLRRFRVMAPDVAAIDYRLAAIGSQLPDLIDKPLKWFFVPGLADDHVYGHTLLLPLGLILVGLLLARGGDLRLFVLGIGCLTHPLVDPTNTYPATLFWPLLGTHFPEATQAYRGYFQIPLDVVLIAVYATLCWRSERWRDRAIAFIRAGAFPFPDASNAQHRRLRPVG